MSFSKPTRTVWALNGYLLLGVILFGIGDSVVSAGSAYWRGDTYERGVIVGERAERASSLDIALQHLIYERPERLHGTPYHYASVYIFDRHLPQEVREAIEQAGDVGPDLLGAHVNEMIVGPSRDQVRRLLPQNGYIERMDLPVERDGILDRDFVLYKLAQSDSDGDGRIGPDDHLSYYLADFDGTNLRQITPDSLQLDRAWVSTEEGVIYFDSVQELEGEFARELAYVLERRTTYLYDIATGSFEVFGALEQEFRQIQADHLSAYRR